LAPDNRGGYRVGSPGMGYPQRTDLNVNRVAMPTVPGQTYGEGAAQRRDLQQVPAGIPKLPPFARATEFPGEHVMSGVSQGPGPGPESLAILPGMGNQTPQQVDVERMRASLPALEKIADLPDSSDAFRAWVRQLRGTVRMT
jgi:hypothetical protein